MYNIIVLSWGDSLNKKYLTSKTTGTIKIESETCVVIKQCSTINASLNVNDYVTDKMFFYDASGRENGRSLFYAIDKENIELTAERNGIINGQGKVANTKGTNAVPGLIRFVNCKNVKITNLTLIDSAFWGIYLQNCENVEINGLTIVSKWCSNNFGICIDSSKNVDISNCTFDTGDDAISIRTTSKVSCENITINNCEISSVWSAIKLGTESVGDFKNITFKNCLVKQALGCALKVAVVDGGQVDGLLIDNIKMQNVTGPIFIVNGFRNAKYYEEDNDSENISKINNVTIKNVFADVIASQSHFSQEVGDCVFVSGRPNAKINGLTIENCEFNMPGGNLVENDYLVEELLDQYPEYYSLGLSPSFGAYFRHVENLKLKDVKIKEKEEDIREKIIFEDVTLC